jgi:hypothetical protein
MTSRQTLRVPKNRRKFNLWESDSLNNTMQKAVQIVHNIETEAEKQNESIHLLGNSNVPMFLLHEICEHYTIMYNRLLKAELLITANPSSNDNLH